MKNLTYDKLNIQDYLNNVNVNLTKNTFRYRTRMMVGAQFTFAPYEEIEIA